MSSNLQNWLNCCELPQCWLCIYLHLKTYLAISRRAGWPACSWWERWWVSERRHGRAVPCGDGAQPGDAAGRVPAGWGPPAAPGAPHLPSGAAPLRAPPAGRAPDPAPPRGCGGSGAGRLPLSCPAGSPGSRHRGQGSEGRAGPGAAEGARGGAGGEERSRGWAAAPVAGRGRCPLAFPPGVWNPPSGKRRSIQGERSCRRCRVRAWAAEGSGRSDCERERSLLEQPAGEDPSPEVRRQWGGGGAGDQSPSENQTSGAAALLNSRCLLVKQVQEIKW